MMNDAPASHIPISHPRTFRLKAVISFFIILGEMEQQQPQREQYAVGWVCALPIETAVAKAMLDETYRALPLINVKDTNAYTLGRIAEHNVVIASLPGGSYGTTSAAVTASNMLSSFPNIRFGLMVGIGGGIPSEENDVRLGDVVVSKPTETYGTPASFHEYTVDLKFYRWCCPAGLGKSHYERLQKDWNVESTAYSSFDRACCA